MNFDLLGAVLGTLAAMGAIICVAWLIISFLFACRQIDEIHEEVCRKKEEKQ